MSQALSEEWTLLSLIFSIDWVLPVASIPKKNEFAAGPTTAAASGVAPDPPRPARGATFPSLSVVERPCRLTSTYLVCRVVHIYDDHLSSAGQAREGPEADEGGSCLAARACSLALTCMSVGPIHVLQL